MNLDLGFKTLDSSVSPGLSRCKPHPASRSIKCLLLFSKTSLCVPSLLVPSGFSKWRFLWPFHFPWTHFLVSRAALSPLKAAHLSPLETSHPHLQPPLLDLLTPFSVFHPHHPRSHSPKGHQWQPIGKRSDLSQSLSCSAFLSVSHCGPSHLHLSGKSTFASTTLVFILSFWMGFLFSFGFPFLPLLHKI